MSQYTGNSYCGGCDRPITTALTGCHKPCSCCIGGRLWEIAPDQYCVCGARQEWLHEPPPEPLEMPVKLSLFERLFR